MFKKKKIRQKRGFNFQNKSSIFGIAIGFVSVFFIVLVGIGFLHQVGNIKFDLSSLISNSGFKLNFDELDKNSAIKKSADGKTNILIIGRGGEENDAPNLTDSIIVGSINYDKKTVSMFSIPRDLYVKYPTGGAGKINEVFARALREYGEETKAIDSLKEVITKITGEEIHYYVNLDFEGFRKVIDTVGGIQVNVPEKIVDTSYPGPNYSYQTFSINPGLQTLNGETALKYARSRHSTSDFDRSLRQQLIVKALREKIISLGFLTKPSKIKSIYTILKEHITSDLDLSQMINLAMFIKEIPSDNIVSSNLNDTCFYGSSACEKGGFLYVPAREDFGGAAVLLQNGATKSSLSNYDSLLLYTNLVFNYPEVFTENLKINVFNSTKVSGLAVDIADKLKKYGFNIPSYKSTGNTAGDKYEKSKIIYTSSGTKVPKTVEALEMFIFGGSEKVDTLPKYSQDPEVKIEIIIGDDYKFLNF